VGIGGRQLDHARPVAAVAQAAHQEGFGGGLTYTLSKSRDNASSIGGGGGVVAQNDKDLNAEWGLSSFDQRHRLAADFNLDLPFGPNRHWLNNDGVAAKILGGWSWTTNVTLASGSPFTVRVVGNASDVAKGTNGTTAAASPASPASVAPTGAAAVAGQAYVSIGPRSGGGERGGARQRR
jgi:hypothetical protein